MVLAAAKGWSLVERSVAQRLTFLTGLHTCDLLVLDDFLTPRSPGRPPPSY
ncbi:hypothetical protein [Microbacterium lacticum]